PPGAAPRRSFWRRRPVRITRLLLERFGPHERLDVRPAAGLTGVVGPNGSGKSTVLAAAEVALTGGRPTPRGPGGAGPPGPRARQRSAVTVEFTHGEAAATLVRALQGASTSLLVKGQDPVKGERNVDEALAALFGRPPASLCRYAFVHQGRLADVVDAGAAG